MIETIREINQSRQEHKIIDLVRYEKSEKIYSSCSEVSYDGVAVSFQTLEKLLRDLGGDTNVLIERTELVKNKKLLNNLVSCWSQSHEVPDYLHAENVFLKLQEYRSYGMSIDTRMLNIVMNAITEKINDSTQVPRLVNRIFNYMEVESEIDTNLLPNDITFTTVLTVLSKSELPETPDCAQTYLKTMTLYHKSEKIEKAPSESLYILLLQTWANSGLEIAGERAEDVLYQMQNSDRIFPGTVAFSVVLNCWGRQKKLSAANRAFAVLKHMEERFKADKKSAKPNTYCYATVIDAYGCIGKAVEAEQVLERLMDAYNESKDPDLQPNAVAFTSTIKAWSKTDSSEGPIRAEKLLERMHKLYLETGNESLAPQTIPFTSVLHAWARCREKTRKASRSEAILMKMQELYASGYEDVRPNRISYATVIDCLAKSNERSAAERAEALLESLIGLYEETGDVNLRPNTVTFTSVMDAWAKSSERHAVSRVEAILRKMEDMYAAGVQDAKPNAISYTIVLRAFATDINADDKTAEKALDILNKMKKLEGKGHKDLAPSTKTYGTVIRIIANRKGPHDNAKKVQELIQEMKNRGLPVDDFSFGYAFLACSRTRGSKAMRNSAFMIARSLYREMQQKVKSPSAATYANFIQACYRNNEKAAEGAYLDCCKYGHGQDTRVIRAVQRVLPHAVGRR
mmetsp:Transcript_23732/g.36024  ORF Transcript_23732/g.36024 Transcript_23732/m.36024 type:complete len:686 (-) Transcript_23732:1666-3723(-)